MPSRRLIALILVALAVAGVTAAAAATRAPAPAASGRLPAERVTGTELPPLPKMRPKVVEPEAGISTDDEPADTAPRPATSASTDEDSLPKPSGAASAGASKPSYAPSGTGSVRSATALPNGVALPPLDAPDAVMGIIRAGNTIARTPYKWGGGHGRWKDNGYDCSGSVSYALAAGGLLNTTLTSGQLAHWGEPGKGKWVTIYANSGHVFMEVAGIRFDTSGTRTTGSRWQNGRRPTAGYVARHPPGL